MHWVNACWLALQSGEAPDSRRFESVLVDEAQDFEASVVPVRAGSHEGPGAW